MIQTMPAPSALLPFPFREAWVVGSPKVVTLGEPGFVVVLTVCDHPR
jgi:hypothetical protein